METKRQIWSLLAATALIGTGATALTGCDRGKDGEVHIETNEIVEADEIAQAEGVADPTAEPPSDAKITAELLLEGDEDIFDFVDTDRDEVVSVAEFDAAADQVNILAAFDVNEDRIVAEDEFHATMFRFWDDDNDNFVEPYEYLMNAKKWFPEDTDELENFADVDANNDGWLSEGEFVANMDDIELFDQWDADVDAKISADELVKALRVIWDIDTNEQITVVEFGGPVVETGTIAGVADIAVAITNPVDFIGTAVSGVGTVTEVVSDRGFWLKSGDAKVFAVVREDVPQKEMIDINAGQKIGFNGILFTPDAADDLAGKLDSETKKLIAEQPAFLGLYHARVEILEKSGG